MTIVIDYSRCKWKNGSCSCDCNCSDSECTGCAEVCPVKAITRKKRVDVEQDKCIECGKCVETCPMNAISLK